MTELIGDTCVLNDETGSKLTLVRVPGVTISGTETYTEVVYLKKVDRFISGLVLSVTWVR